MLRETAKAKVNLTLRVLGRRPDGYNELQSLAAFAGIGDEVSLEPGKGFGLDVKGPFAGALQEGNLIEEAANRVASICPDCRIGNFQLEKRLPVAAGIGGGSADAAAALRLLMRANPDRLTRREVVPLAPRLGADVPVCLLQRYAMFWGLGECVEPLEPPLEIPAVLVNPGNAIGTADVFARLDAEPISEDVSERPEAPPPFDTISSLVRYLEASGNDLEETAIELAPVIAEVKASISGEPGCLMARMSGSGATCFGIFGDLAGARHAAGRLARNNPSWWVAASSLS